MQISAFALFACLLCALTTLTFTLREQVHRRVTRPLMLTRTALALTVLLVPPNLFLAITSTTDPGRGLLTAWWVDLLVTTSALVGLVALAHAHRIPRAPAHHPRRILAIGAHPDDLELACGGTLAKLFDSGHEVHALVMTAGERGGDSRVRRGEAELGSRFLGATSLEVVGLPDLGLAQAGDEMVAAIERAIRRYNPDVVLTHSAHDQHQDHCAVHLATLRAARQHPSILCFESPSATADFRPSVFIDIDGYVDVKVAAVAAHQDQSGKPYMAPDRVRGTAAFRGSQAKAASAEAFEPVRLLTSSGSDL